MLNHWLTLILLNVIYMFSLTQEFEMDPGIRKELEKQTNDKIELVRRELAWEAEKHRISLKKLKNRLVLKHSSSQEVHLDI